MSVLRHPQLDWRKAVVLTHRWLGIAGGLLFLAWFVSGLVMMYARMPALPAGELQRRLPPLDLSHARVSPAGLALESERPIERVRIGMLLDRPIYRLFTGRTSSTVFADTGETLQPLTVEAALAVARALVPEHAKTIYYDALVGDPDQWTMEARAAMPLHRIALGDAADSVLYISQPSGEAVMRTTRHERRWAYAGAVIHWLYFAPLRRQSALWAQTIIWLSIAGCVLAATGLVWGLTMVHRSPYVGLLKWHHYAGLIFGLATLTWVFSGLLSMDPWAWSPGTAPSRAERERVAGGPLQLAPLSIERLHAAARKLADAAGPERLKELELQQFQGELYLAGGSRLISTTHPEAAVFEVFPEDAMRHAAHVAMPDASIEDLVWLRAYDSYYYDRDGHLRLPILRVRYRDANKTWLYFDPRRGEIVRKEARLSRVNRWLYHGLHSLDFPFLYYRRPLWDAMVIALSIGGIVLSATTLLPGWRRMRRAISRWWPSPRPSSSDR